jgi:hypothetical protein
MKPVEKVIRGSYLKNAKAGDIVEWEGNKYRVANPEYTRKGKSSTLGLTRHRSGVQLEGPDGQLIEVVN